MHRPGWPVGDIQGEQTNDLDAGGRRPGAGLESNLPGVWIDVTPDDDYVDGGGFTPFERFYDTFPVLVTLTAPKTYNGSFFLRWNFDTTAAIQIPSGPERGPTLQLWVWSPIEVEAIYQSPSPDLGGRR